MLDYIYQGEVQIYQEHLDRFLNIAKKFNLDGLVAPDDNSDNCKDEDFKASSKYYQENDYESLTLNEDTIPTPKIVKERSVKIPSQTFEANNSEVDSKFEELVVNENNMWRCTVCNKTMKYKSDMKRHLESHLSGLSYDCQICGSTFRSVDSLRRHKYRKQHL